MKFSVDKSSIKMRTDDELRDLIVVGRFDAALEHCPSHRALHCAGIKVNRPEPPIYVPRNTPFSRGRRAVDCHDAMRSLCWHGQVAWPQFFAAPARKQVRDYSSTGAAGTSVPITGVLLR